MQSRAIFLAFVPSVVAWLSACTEQPPAEIAEATPSALALPAYRFELKARSSENPSSAAGAFQVPAGAFIKNMTPSINDRGDLALDFRAFDNLQHVWKNGRIVHDVADSKAVITGTSINLSGDVAFDVMGAESGNGVFVHRAATGQTAFFTSEPLSAESWINVRITDDGRVGCRAGGGGNHFLGFPDPKGFTKLAVESATNPNSPYEYIFSPAFDRNGTAAVKVMLVTGGEEIRIFKLGSGAVTVAQDARANPASSFATIDNGVAFSESGQVAFIAKVGAKRAVFRTDGTVTTRIASAGESGIAEIAWFTPAINASGLVVFKGEDTERRNAIWVGDGKTLTKLVTAGDALPSDKGIALALPETESDPQNRVTFGGAVVINARGDIVFSAALAQPTEAGPARLGTGIYLAAATR